MPSSLSKHLRQQVGWEDQIGTTDSTEALCLEDLEFMFSIGLTLASTI